MQNIRQGEMYWVQLNPTLGKEQKGLRPCVVVSGNSMNDHLGRSIVCPMTTVLKHYYGDVIVDPGSQNTLKTASEILVSQVRMVDHICFEKKIGVIDDEQLQQALRGIVLMLTK